MTEVKLVHVLKSWLSCRRGIKRHVLFNGLTISALVCLWKLMIHQQLYPFQQSQVALVAPPLTLTKKSVTRDPSSLWNPKKLDKTIWQAPQSTSKESSTKYSTRPATDQKGRGAMFREDVLLKFVSKESKSERPLNAKFSSSKRVIIDLSLTKPLGRWPPQDRIQTNTVRANDDKKENTKQSYELTPAKSDLGKDASETSQATETTKDCLSWCMTGNGKSHYFLTAVLLVRIYKEDLPQLSTREMMQWLTYLRYAGVEHVYIYDAYHMTEESQSNALDFLVKEGYVTYIDWSSYANPYGIQKTQVSAYQHCIDRWGKDSVWQTAIDIDEYPFSPEDTKPGFLRRFIKTFSRKYREVSEISMENFLFLGKPSNDSQHPYLIDRIVRRTHSSANNLVKPIYQPRKIRAASVHHNVVGEGHVLKAPTNQLRMNHYWGARLQNWGENTPKIISITRPDESIREIMKTIVACEKCVGKDNLRKKRWS